MNINKEIIIFSKFITKTFGDILLLSKNIEERDIILADQIENGYLQFIWEMIVENSICSRSDFLEIYGEGADFHIISSRVTYSNEKVNKIVVVNVVSSIDLISQEEVTNQTLEFENLVYFKDGYYYKEPPFNFVLCEDEMGRQFIFQINTVDFILKDIEEEF